MRQVLFKVLGPPKGKARPRVTSHGTFTPRETVMYENYVKFCYQEWSSKMFGGPVMLEGPISALIVAYFPIPKSTSKKRADLMRGEKIFPTKKPDADNIAKSILDALNGIAYLDDSQVVEVTVQKRYSDEPRVDVMLEEKEEE